MPVWQVPESQRRTRPQAHIQSELQRLELGEASQYICSLSAICRICVHFQRSLFTGTWDTSNLTLLQPAFGVGPIYQTLDSRPLICRRLRENWASVSTFSTTNISQRPWIPNLEEWKSCQLIYLEAAAGNGSGKRKVEQYVYVILK